MQEMRKNKSICLTVGGNDWYRKDKDEEITFQDNEKETSRLKCIYQATTFIPPNIKVDYYVFSIQTILIVIIKFKLSAWTIFFF